MQPYFFPYIGYFQLISAVDSMVIYDNIEFTKKGWVHRNRILLQGKDIMFSLSLDKASDFLMVKERSISQVFQSEKKKILRQISSAYSKAPYFSDVYPLVEECFNFEDTNLFSYVFNSIKRTCAYLEIETPLLISSEVAIDHTLKGSDRVLALSEALKADTYINPIGGVDLYSKDEFRERGIELSFLRPRLTPYEQLGQAFVPALSIIDVLMFNGKKGTQDLLKEYELV